MLKKELQKLLMLWLKKAGDKIGNVLRRKAKRPAGASRGAQRTAIPAEVKKGTMAEAKQPGTYYQDMIKLNNLIAQL